MVEVRLLVLRLNVPELKFPASEKSVPEVAGSKPFVVLYLNPLMVAFAPPVAVMSPFRVADIPPIPLAAEVVTVGEVTQEEVACVKDVAADTHPEAL